MKKILKPVGTVFGFLGITTFVLFYIMSPRQNQVSPPTNLAADIGANVPGNSDGGSATVPDAGAAPADSSSVSQAPTADSPQVISPATSVPAPDPTPASAPASIQAPAPAGPSSYPELPQASTTITVTPTAPPPPPTAPSTPSPIGSNFILPYSESNFAGDDNWEATWGSKTVTGSGALDLSAGPSSFGGGVFLKPAVAWANYTMTANLDLVGGETFGLMANYADASNYVLCEYTKSDDHTFTAELEQYVNGYETALSPVVSIPSSDDASDLAASIKVDGIYGTCSLNGVTTSNEGIGPGKSAMSNPGVGSVGFVVKDSEPDVSQIIVKQVSVVGE